MRKKYFLNKKFLRIISTLQAKLVLIFVLISIVLMISVSIALIYSVESTYYATLKQKVNTALNSWGISDNPSKEEIIEYFVNNKKDALIIFGLTEYKTLSVVDSKNKEIIITNEEKTNLNNSNLFNQFLSSQNFINALVGESGNKGKLNYVGNKVFFDYAIKKGDFILYFRSYREEWQGSLNKFNQIIGYSFLFAIIFSLITGYFLSKAITIPLKNLMLNARRIASGDFERLLIVNSKDEIGQLTSSFNYMAGQLKNKLHEVSSEKNKIETIINSIDDGVIAYNKIGEVIHVNLYAKNIFGEEVTNLSIYEFCDNFKILLKPAQLISTKENKSDNDDIIISVNNKVIKLKVAVFSNNSEVASGVILVFHDITEERLLDDMRKEFVANVSHELRTPLTSIKSYTETILEGAIEDRKTTEKFLTIVVLEVDRMTRMVKDLLLLSKVDSMKMEWEIKDVRIDGIIDNTVEMFRIEADKNNIEFIKEEFEACTIKGDKDRLEQVFINIISNSLIYSKSGGKVNISIKKQASDVVISIEDTGIGIPLDDQKRIFERFYRVDKARSRELGGTGLGLAIAKDIVKAHNGHIEVESKIGEGTKIIVKLPLAINC